MTTTDSYSQLPSKPFAQNYKSICIVRTSGKETTRTTMTGTCHWVHLTIIERVSITKIVRQKRCVGDAKQHRMQKTNYTEWSNRENDTSAVSYAGDQYCVPITICEHQSIAKHGNENRFEYVENVSYRCICISVIAWLVYDRTDVTRNAHEKCTQNGKGAAATPSKTTIF